MDDPDALAWLANAYELLGRLDLAETCAREALANAPEPKLEQQQKKNDGG
jgi:uncharacterized protein HemY